EQRHGEAAVHHADRVVVPLARDALEYRVAGLDLDQTEAEQLRDRRRGQAAVADRAQVLDACHRASGRGERLRVVPADRDGAQVLRRVHRYPFVKTSIVASAKQEVAIVAPMKGVRNQYAYPMQTYESPASTASARKTFDETSKSMCNEASSR